MRALNTGPRRILSPELFGRLPAPRRLQSFVVLTRLQTDDAGLDLRLGASWAQRTRRAILAGEPRLERHAVLGVGVGQPGDALFARWAGHHLAFPVDDEVPLVEPVAGARLPAGIVGHRPDDRHVVFLLTVDEDL